MVLAASAANRQLRAQLDDWWDDDDHNGIHFCTAYRDSPWNNPHTTFDLLIYAACPEIPSTPPVESASQLQPLSHETI